MIAAPARRVTIFAIDFVASACSLLERAMGRGEARFLVTSSGIGEAAAEAAIAGEEFQRRCRNMSGERK